MFNFTDLVSDILLKEQTPQETASSSNDVEKIKQSKGFMELVNGYGAQYGQPPDVKEILQAANIVTGGGYIAKKYTNIGYTPFIDAFAQVYATIEDNKKANYTQSQIIDQIVNNPEAYDPIFNEIAKNLRNTAKVQEYSPANPDVNRVWRSLVAEANKLSQTAIQSLGSDTVHSAITKIIAKRIPVIDRLVGVKGLMRPFNAGTIKPVLLQFKRYTGYKQGDIKKNPKGWLKDRSWPKKVSGDFSKMVEGITIDNLINVAVLAYEYYIYLLGTQGKPLNTQNQQTSPQPVNASLNIFTSFVNNILNEYDYTDGSNILGSHNPGPASAQQQVTAPATQQQFSKGRLLKNLAQNRAAVKSSNYKETKPQQQQNQEATGLPPEQLEKITNEVGNLVDPDYESFLFEGTSRYLPDVKYNLSTISKDPSREAQDLYKALTNMAYFVKTGVGAKNITSALGALTTGMGPVN
jgi:hypothetical protein